MAGFAEVQPSSTNPVTNRTYGKSPATAIWRLPNGHCNFRDLSFGAGTPSCGCRTFWRKTTSHVRGGEEREDETRCQEGYWCWCGHHACYHTFIQGCAIATRRADEEARQDSREEGAEARAPDLPAHVQCVQAERSQFLSRAQAPSHWEQERSKTMNLATQSHPRKVEQVASAVFQAEHQSLTTSCVNNLQVSGVSLSHQSHHLASPNAPLSGSAAGRTRSGRGHGMASRSYSATNNNPGLNSAMAQAYSMSLTRPPQAVKNGLGIELPSSSINRGPRLARAVAGHTNDMLHITSRMDAAADAYFPSVVAPSEVASTTGTGPRARPSRVFMQHVSQHRQALPPIDMSHVQYPNYLGENCAQSATELATPSNPASHAGTPDMRMFEYSLHGARQSVDMLLRHADSHFDQPSKDKAPPFSTPGGNHPLVGNLPPEPVAEPSLAPVLREGPNHDMDGPALLDQFTPNLIMSHLSLLKQQLASFQGLPSTLQMLGNRVEALENASFSFGGVEDVQEKLELQDGRLIDVEGRLAEIEKLHAADDLGLDDEDNHARQDCFRAISVHGPAAAGRMQPRFMSSPSHSLIDPAFGDFEANARFEDMEQRLMDLEYFALPSNAHPWTIEVVLLPWGQELKGIWFPPDEIETGKLHFSTQESDAWRKAQHIRHGAREGFLPSADVQSEWDEQAIKDWAHGSAQWLSAKACGTKGVVYDRLRSRGFVRNVTITASSARVVYSAICTAFEDLLETSNGRIDEEGRQQHLETSPELSSYLGLKAAFVPLRKIHKSSRLRFLDPSEMLTPALWTTEFLASSVVMRAIGGQKRLFITTSTAYLQRHSSEIKNWTWQRLRELPRMFFDQEGGDPRSRPHVAEANAKEPCWAYEPQLDPLKSVNTSFCSDASHASRLDTTHRQATPHSPDGALLDIGNDGQSSQVPHPPITPTSEFPSHGRPEHVRTTSLPLVHEPELELQQSKRRIASFGHYPHSAATKKASADFKRRRYSRTPEIEVHTGAPFTPRRSREPPSIFHSSQPHSQHDVETIRSMGSRRKARRPTPSAYATPHSLTLVKADTYESGRGSLDAERVLQDDLASDGRGDEDGEVWEGVGDEDEHGKTEESSLSSLSDFEERYKEGIDQEDDDGDGFDDDMEDVG